MTVAYYVGTTGTGKTTLMCQHALAKAAERAVPAILLDSEGVVGADKFDAPTARDVVELTDLVWRDGQHVRFHPREPADVARLAETIRAGKDCVLLVDEISYWGRGASPIPELARLFRVHRHRNCDLYATSQYPGDISPLIWNIRSDTYVFRNDSLRALERLGEELRLDKNEVDAIASLPNLKYIHFQTGLRRNPPGDGAPGVDAATSRGSIPSDAGPPPVAPLGLGAPTPTPDPTSVPGGAGA